jgi:hypothetical protein
MVIPRKGGYRYELRSETAIVVQTGGGLRDVSRNGLGYARLQKHREPRRAKGGDGAQVCLQLHVAERVDNCGSLSAETDKTIK